jgi:hypothetical protein
MVLASCATVEKVPPPQIASSSEEAMASSEEGSAFTVMRGFNTI